MKFNKAADNDRLLQTIRFNHHSTLDVSEETTKSLKELSQINWLPILNHKRSAHQTPDTNHEGNPQLTIHQSRHLNLSKNLAHQKPNAKFEDGEKVEQERKSIQLEQKSTKTSYKINHHKYCHEHLSIATL